MDTPSFKEDHISQIPALQMLVRLGYAYLSPAEAERQRGGKALKPDPRQRNPGIGEPEQRDDGIGADRSERVFHPQQQAVAARIERHRHGQRG